MSLNEEMMMRAFRKLYYEDSGPQTIIMSDAVFRAYWFHLHKTIIRIDWDRVLFPRLTRFQRGVHYRWLRWKYRRD